MSIASIILQVIMLIISIQRQQAMARRMAEMQDAQKGFEFTVEGEAKAVPVIYGRNLVGGSRVYHKTSSNYNHASIGSNSKEFVKGLTGSQSEGKNDFLFFQQVLAHGEISAVHEMVIDDSRFYNNSDFDPGLRANVYLAGNQADPMMTANFAERSTATFTDLAYASICLKLNRDNPQFNAGIPQIQFMVDGLKIHTIVRSGTVGNYSYALSSTKTYSNNPAYCLLDYLLNNKYGRGISVNQINLETFYNSAQVCNTIVMGNIETQGNIWRPTDGSRSITSRNIPLYECNLTLDPESAVRDNIIVLLETMKGAELVWSGGKYKLLLQYPRNTNEIILAGTITDDDILQETVSIKWPSASERLNYTTVKYKNEAINFKEDTVSWPPKTSSLYSTFLNEDNNIPLDSEFFEPGIKDYYHALSKAEERVRRSRYSVMYGFTARIEGVVYEPGDIIQLQSNLLDIPNEYIQIQSIKFNEDYTAAIEAVRFDTQMLAWNVADTEPSKIIPSYSFTITPPSNIFYTRYTNISLNYAYGLLQWTPPLDDSANSYIIEYRKNTDSEYSYLGETTGLSYEIFGLPYGNYYFKIKSKSLGGRLSNSVISDIILIEDGTESIPAITLSDDIILTNGKIDSRLIIDITSNEPLFFSGYEIEVKNNNSTTWISLGISKSTRYIFPGVIDNNQYDVRIRAVNALGRVGNYTYESHIIVGKTAPPSDVVDLIYENNISGTKLTWAAVTDPDLELYEIRIGSSWINSTLVDITVDNFYNIKPSIAGSYNYLIKAKDTTGNYSINEDSITVTILSPTIPIFDTPEIQASTLNLSWTTSQSPFPIVEYIISSNSIEIARSKTNKFSLIIDWVGSKTFEINAVDIAGNISNGDLTEISIVNPSIIIDYRTQVIDNNILFYWKPPLTGTLPIASYRIKRGSTWASATLIGDTNTEFFTYFETKAGTYTYWIAAINSAGYEGTPDKTTVTVSQPPDYELLLDYYTPFTSTKINMYDNSGDGYILPVDTTETWSQHFTNHSWTSIEDPINSGYTVFIQPTLSSGYYEEIYDYGTILPNTKISIDLTYTIISGTPSISVFLSTSSDGISYTAYEETNQLFVSGIRYVKFKVVVDSGDDKGLIQLKQINLVLDYKLQSDSGSANITNATNGVTINFNKTFLDITSINVTAAGTTPRIAMYDFVDILNPTSFTAYLFDLSGNKTTGNLSWRVTGY